MASECVYIRLWGAKSTDNFMELKVDMPRVDFMRLISGKFNVLESRLPTLLEENDLVKYSDQGDTTKFCTLGETPEKTNLQGIDITIHKQPILFQDAGSVHKYLKVTGLTEQMIADLNRYCSVQVRKGRYGNYLYEGDVTDFKTYLNERCCGYFLDDLTDPFEKSDSDTKDIEGNTSSLARDTEKPKINLYGADITIYKQPVLIDDGGMTFKYMKVTGLTDQMIGGLHRLGVDTRMGKYGSFSYLFKEEDVGDLKKYLDGCCNFMLHDLTDPLEGSKQKASKPLELSEDSDESDSDTDDVSDREIEDADKINLCGQGIVIYQDKVKILCGLENKPHFVIEGLLHVQRRRLEEELNISLLQKSEEKQSWYFPCESQDDIEGILDDTYCNYRLHVADPTVEEDEVLSSKVAVFHSCIPNTNYQAVTGVSSYTCTKVLYLSDYKKGTVGDKLRESIFGKDSKFSFACHSSKIRECEENLRKEGFAIEFCECDPKIADDDKVILNYTLSAAGAVIHTSLLGKQTRFFQTVKEEMDEWSFNAEGDVYRFSKCFPPGRVTPSQQSRRVAVIHECIPTRCYIGVSGDISEDVIRTHRNWQLVSEMNLSTQKVMVGDARNIKFIVAIGCGHEFVENQLTRHGYDVKWCRKEGTDECVKFTSGESSSGKSSSQESIIAKGETFPPKICPRLAYKGTAREKKCIQPVYRRGMCKNHFQKKYWYMKAKKPATKA